MGTQHLGQFHDFDDTYSMSKREASRTQGAKQVKQMWPTFEDYYRWVDAGVVAGDYTNTAMRGTISSGEMYWYESNRPYYRVYPDYQQMFGHTGLNVPLTQLKMPYHAFAVRFMVGREPRYDDVCVKSCLLSVRDDVVVSNNNLYRLVDPSLADKAVVILLLHLGRLSVGSQHTAVSGLWFLWDKASDEAKTVEDCVQRTSVNKSAGGVLGADIDEEKVLRDMLSVCINTGLVATYDDEAEDDVLPSDIKAYIEAVNAKNKDAARQLAARATRHRNGQPGFSFGASEWLLGRRHDYDGTGSAVGVPLQLGHMRKGHHHWYWYGPGKTLKKQLWVRPCRVGKDLPMSPNRHGEHTLDSVATQNKMLSGSSSQ